MRSKLSEKFPEERDNICKKIIEILELDTDNSFLLCKLDEDIEKQEKLLNMKDEIKRVFECSTISSFKTNFECKRPYLNIVRSILRKQKYNIENKECWIKFENGLMKRTVKYKIYR